MLLAKIDEERMLDLVRTAPLIAFQARDYGFAMAAPGEAYYAPIEHPGGGNLMESKGTFIDQLGRASLRRLSQPKLRTLRPTAQPLVTTGLRRFLETTCGATIDAMSVYAKAPGDHQEVRDYECQVVIQAIEEHGRPDLKDAISHVKLEFIGECTEAAIDALEKAQRGLITLPPSMLHTRLHLGLAATALKNALAMLLEP